jgi:hypothetical protein
MNAKVAPDEVTVKHSVPVTHWVNLWMSPAGTLLLGDRHDSLSSANVKNNHDNKRICILKITTTVEVA